jgi:hypothetical protein
MEPSDRDQWRRKVRRAADLATVGVVIAAGLVAPVAALIGYWLGWWAQHGR